MSLAENVPMSAVRIIGDIPDTRTILGRRRGAIGTGFIVHVPAGHGEFNYSYVVTAHHVIEDQPLVQIQAPDPRNPEELVGPITVADWRQPLDNVDFALAPVVGPLELAVAQEKQGWPYLFGLGLKETFLELGASPRLGAAVNYVGILAPLDRPMVRSGTVGAVNQSGIKYEGGYEFPAHLIDCRSYGGFSGSPCFFSYPMPVLEEQPWPRWHPPEQEVPTVGVMAYLSVFIGMLTHHLADDNADGTASRYGVGIVLPSYMIALTLLSEEMAAERQAWDEAFLAQREAAS